MAACSPQRYLANDRNLVRAATLFTPSTVLPVADSVLELPIARDGTGRVVLSGSYSGAEETTFDIEVTDNSITVPLVSVPVFTGAGSGALSNIVSTGTAQTYTLQLTNAGVPEVTAGIAFEGVRIIARAVGAAGNGIEIEIDQSTLTFTPQDFSLLTDLDIGDGGPTTGVEGAAFDWDTKVLSVDNIIPANAHRVSFGDDTGTVYLQYKQYVDNVWRYHFVPAIKRHIPKGTRISFVTGGRTVTVTDLTPTTETFTGIVTVYDLLNSFVATSALVTVAGVVAYDRSPTGQASRELLIRTDAHCEPSTGTGSSFAQKGFVDTFANSNAATELVAATCTAVTSKDHPLARVGAERWKLAGSVSGDLGEIVTGVPFTDPAGKFGLTIEQELPDGYGTQRGRFTLTGVQYVSRADDDKPPICVVAMTLGSEAVDQTVTMVWTKRPTGDCACGDMPIPRLSGRCLGIFDTDGGDDVGYAADTIARLVALYDWYASTAEARTAYAADTSNPVVGGAEQGAIGVPYAVVISASPPFEPVADLERLKDLIAQYESTIAELDPLDDTTLRAAGMAAWDAAVTTLEYDIDAVAVSLASFPTERYLSLLNVSLISGGVSPLGKTDASVLSSGDGCWRDGGGDFWSVVGSDKGGYAPAFNGIPYYSSRLAADGKLYFSTKEYGFQINIKCPELLVYGDTITLAIGDSGFGATYQIGDELILPIIAAQPLTLAGGQDGNEILDWYVSGSVDGALANFEYDPDASPPGDYSDSGLAFTYTPGGIPNKAGDKFVFTVEGGHYRYRQDGGSWIVPGASDIDDAVVSFLDGLSIQWLPGAAPSFAVGDTYSFRVAQPWAVSNLQTPNRYRWQWNEVAPTLVIDLGSAQAISMAAIARHTIPAGATITIEGGTSPGVYTWSEALTWSADVIASEFAQQTSRYLRLTLYDALDGGIGWLFAGTALTTEYSAAIQIRRVYKIESASAGLDQSGNYLGRANSGSLQWTEAALSEADVTGIAALLDWAKTHNDEPFVLVPNITRPTEAYCVLVGADDVEFAELSDYNRDATYDRRYSISVPFAGVWR